jgi:pyrimidine-specific ribonucleoside hydrolase
MIKRIINTLLLFALICGDVLAHSGKPKYHVVIDTDGALDDMRAISMLLAGNDIRVLAITCSAGTLPPDSVFVKVSSLLSAFHHEGIPVGVSEGTTFENPEWGQFAQDIRWGSEGSARDIKPGHGSVEVLNRATETYPQKVTLIALGSLKTYSDWIKANENAAAGIERIIWYNSLNIREGFNYHVSPESFEFIRESGIPLEVVSSNREDLMIGQEYLNQVHGAGSVYARRIEEVHAQPPVAEKTSQRHLHLRDDMVPLYLTVPVMFEIEAKPRIKLVSLSRDIPSGFVYETVGKLLVSAASTNNRVFAAFPVDTALYKPGYASILNETIEKFGLIEWKAICMTNEVHGHTGIYSIVGAKMGIRAMEFFNVGVNNMEVITFAGSNPPLSCFNDGVQISTGATIGQGLITVSDSVSAVPSAIFEFNHQKVHISLKPEIAMQMQQEISECVKNFGLLSDKYWLYIEDLAIRYWVGFDRQEIFTIETL